MENLSLGQSIFPFLWKGYSDRIIPHKDGKEKNRIQQAEADSAGGLRVCVSGTPESVVCCCQPNCATGRGGKLLFHPLQDWGDMWSHYFATPTLWKKQPPRWRASRTVSPWSEWMTSWLRLDLTWGMTVNRRTWKDVQRELHYISICFVNLDFS